MIERINSTSSMIFVSQGNSSGPYIDMTAPSSGMVRWNSNSNNLEVFDGNQNLWLAIKGTDAAINLDYNAEKAMKWAIDRMSEEEEWYKLATTNEAVRIALEQLEQAKTRLELTAILARDHEQKTS